MQYAARARPREQQHSTKSVATRENTTPYIYSQSHPKIRREPPSREIIMLVATIVVIQQQQQQQSAFLSPFNYVRSHCPLSLIKSNPSNRAKRERELWV